MWPFDPAAQLGLMAGALAAEAAMGYPDPVFRAIRHPVIWIGALIERLDRTLNRSPRLASMPFFFLFRWRERAGGVLAVLILLLATIVPALALQAILFRAFPGWLAWPLLVLAASPFLAQRSLYTFVAAVGAGLRRDGLPGGRAAVAHIVGRNPLSLDEPAVVRAAIESLAENFSDGVVAPAVWGALAGLPGIVAYKAINTADSMIGHRTPRHEAFGWAAARLDDLVNLPASRLAAFWLIFAACCHRHASPSDALRAVLRDARHHRSPNAGWPEAAMAGALGLRLAGPRVYGDTPVNDAWMGEGRSDAVLADLDRALALYRTACGIEIAAATGLWVLIARG